MRLLLAILAFFYLADPVWAARQSAAGATDKISVASSTAYDVTEFTVMGWFYIDTLAEFKVLVARRNAGSTTGFDLEAWTPNTTLAWGVAVGGTMFISTVASALTSGTWMHLAMRYRQSDGLKQLVKNGAQIGTATNTGTYSQPTGESIAWLNDASDNKALPARVADGRYYAAFLTDAEIADAMRGGPGLTRGDACRAWLPFFGVSSPEPNFCTPASTGTLTNTVRIDHPPALGFPMMSARRIGRTPVAATGGVSRMLLLGVGP